MSITVLKVNGLELGPYLDQGGLVYKRNDVDSAEAGELANGQMRRDRVIIRPTLDVRIDGIKTFIDDQLVTEIMNALEPQFLDVTYYDPRLGREVNRRFYGNNITVSLFKVEKGRRRWIIDPFTLVAEGVAGDGRADIE